MQDGVKVGCGPALVGGVEGDVFLGRGVDSHGAGHGGIGGFPRLNAGGGVENEAGLEVLAVQPVKELGGIGEKPCYLQV